MARWLDQKIDSDLKELEELRELALSLSAFGGSGIPGGGRKEDAPFVHGLERVWEKVPRRGMEQRLNDEIDNLIDLNVKVNFSTATVRDGANR